MKDTGVFIVLFLQLFCRIEILPNETLKEWEQRKKVAMEKRRGKGRVLAVERGHESRKAAETVGRWRLAGT